MAGNFTRVNDGIIVKINGLDNLKKALLDIPRKLRVRALRNALASGGRVIRNAARRRAPTLDIDSSAGSYAYRKYYRTPNLLRDSISVRTSRNAKKKGDVGVFVNVRPAKGWKRGARSRHDPYYWRWMEFGFRGRDGKKFLQHGATMIPRALNVFQTALAKAFRKLNANPKAVP